MRRFRSLSVVLLLAIAAVPAPPAHASPGAMGAVVVGSGTISPGLTLTVANQSFTFTTGNLLGLPSVFGAASAGATPPATAGFFSCTFSGGGVETPLTGEGTGSGTCSGPGLSMWVAFRYNRIGVNMLFTYSFSATINGATSLGTGLGLYLWLPTTINPITSYQLAGAAGLAMF